MKTSVRNIMVTLAALTVSFATAGICKMNNVVSVSADTQSVIVENQNSIGVSMVNGASVRIKDTQNNEGNGLRFAMQMETAAYDEFMANENYADQQFGIIIVPDIATYDDVSYDTVFGAQKKYDWATWVVSEDGKSGEWVYTGTEEDAYTRIMLYSFDKMYKNDFAWEDQNNVYVRSTISNIKNETGEYRGIGFVTYKDNSSGESVQQSVFLKPQVRSMTYVAQRAVEAGEENAEWLYQQYIKEYTITGTKPTKTTVTQEYFLQQKNGEYALNSELTEILSENIYINDEVTGHTPDIDGYVITDHAQSVTSGNAYANGKLTLKSYYNLFNPSNFVTDSSLLTAKRTNNSTGGVHESKTVAACDEIITDRKGAQISKTAAFKVDLGDLTGKNALGDGCVELKLSSAALTKSTLKSLIAKGYTSLNFSIYRQWTTSETWECGFQITTLDFDKLRAGTPSVNDSSATVRSSYSTKVEISGGSNKWKTISYSLTDLLEFYDVIFSPSSNYFLAEAGVGIVGTNEALYISAFEVKKIDANSLVTDSSLIMAKYGSWWGTDTSMTSNGKKGKATTEVKVESYNQYVSNRLGATVNINAAYRITLPGGTDVDAASKTTTMITLSDAGFMPKTTLKALIAEGYKALTFSVYRQVYMSETWENGLFLSTIDFVKMRDNKASVTDIDTAGNNYNRQTIGSATNKWQTITYNLSDLLEFYDVLFAKNSPYFLCMIGVGTNSTDNYVYISPFILTKAEVIANVVADSTLLAAKYGNVWVNTSMTSSGNTTKALVNSCNVVIADRQGNAGVEKTAAYKIDSTVSGELGATMIQLSNVGFIPKDTLKSLIDDGYTTFSFSVYRYCDDINGNSVGSGLYFRTIDFAKMRNGVEIDGATKKPTIDDKDTAKNFYTARTNIGSRTNTWVDVTYNLSDLLEFYDVLFAKNSPYFLCEICSGASPTYNNCVYMTAFEIGK